MTRFLINAISAKSGGGKAIAERFVAFLAEQSDGTERFFVIAPNDQDYRRFEGDHLSLVPVAPLYRHGPFMPWFYAIAARRLVRAYSIDVVFNLADLVFVQPKPQIYLFDWAHLVYPDSIVWSRMGPTEYLWNRVKEMLIVATLHHVTLAVAQTETMARRLAEVRGMSNVVTIPQAVMMEQGEAQGECDFGLPSDRTKLLFLSTFAAHKNFDLIAPLARLVKAAGGREIIVTTLDESEAGVSRMLRDIRSDGLGGYVLNVGRVIRQDVPSLLRQSDALFLPTLLESYGLPLVEAMQEGLPVLTSDTEFTRDVCGDAAFYFDPLDPGNAYSMIREAFRDQSELKRRVERGISRVQALPSEEAVFSRYLDLMRGFAKRGPTQCAGPGWKDGGEQTVEGVEL